MSGCLSPKNAAREPALDCNELEAWMEANVRESFRAENFERLEHNFRDLAGWGPAFENWKTVALDGAAAAKRHDRDAAGAACRRCHDEYKAAYRKACKESKEQ